MNRSTASAWTTGWAQEADMGATLNDRREPAEICREKEWPVGTMLVGDEGYGPTVIEITAIGEHAILAKVVSHNGRPRPACETLWTLSCRDWHVVPNVKLRGAALLRRPS